MASSLPHSHLLALATEERQLAQHGNEGGVAGLRVLGDGAIDQEVVFPENGIQAGDVALMLKRDVEVKLTDELLESRINNALAALSKVLAVKSVVCKRDIAAGKDQITNGTMPLMSGNSNMVGQEKSIAGEQDQALVRKDDGDEFRLNVGQEKNFVAASGGPKAVATRDMQNMTRSFAEATRGQRSERQLKRVEVQFDKDGGVLMPDTLAEKGIRRWENTLVGVVLGRTIPFAVIERNVRRMWQNWGILEVIKAGTSMVFIRFGDDKHFEMLLRRGDWNIVGCPFMIRRWAPGLTYDSLEPVNLPLWIKLKNIPFEYRHFEGIEYIVSSIGKPLKIDSGFNSREGIRVQVEFDAANPITRSLRLIGVRGQVIEVKVDYEFIPPQCLHCRVFGHDEGRCQQEKEGRIPEQTRERRWQKVYVKRRESEKMPNNEEPVVIPSKERVLLEAVDVVQSTFVEEVEVAKDTSTKGIPIVVNHYQVLAEVEERASTPPVAAVRASSPSSRPSSPKDKIMVPKPTGLDDGATKEDSMEDLSNSYDGDNLGGRSDGSMLSENEVIADLLTSPPRTRNRMKEVAAKGGAITKNGRKSRKASK